MAKRIVGTRMVPGEPLDGSGRACIHLFVQDEESGSFVEPHALHPLFKDGELVKQQVIARPTRGRLACNPRKTVAPVNRSGMVIVTHRTDDPRAVTCPRCCASVEYARVMEMLEGKNSNT